MDQQQIYKQIPLASPDGRCIICNRRLHEKRDATVVLYNRKDKTDKCVHRQFLCCYACMKWENDIDFVINYKVNPQRFLIGNKIFKK